MTTSTISRLISALAVSATLLSLAGRADPASTAQFNISGGGLAPLGLPDRDEVRNPYSTLMGTAGSFSGLLPPSVGVVGPNLGLGVGFSPGLIFGGGGGGGASSFGLTTAAFAPPSGSNSGGFNPGSFGGTSTVVTASGLTSPAIILPPGGGSSSDQTTTIVSNIVVPQSVPDGGHTAILLGSGLVLASLFRRRMARGK